MQVTSYILVAYAMIILTVGPFVQLVHLDYLNLCQFCLMVVSFNVALQYQVAMEIISQEEGYYAEMFMGLLLAWMSGIRQNHEI